jgi:endoglucanase
MSRTKKTAAWVLSLTLVFGLAAGCSDGDGGGEREPRGADTSGEAAGGPNGEVKAEEKDGANAGTDAVGETAADDGAKAVGEVHFDGEDIKVNQVGYLPDAPKIAVLEGDAEADRFLVVDAATKTVVFEGEIGRADIDVNSGERVRHLDFSPLAAEGEYAVVVPGAGSSVKFRIARNVYYAPFFDALRSYTLGRSGLAIDDPVTGLKHAAGHTQDAEAMLDIDHPHAPAGTAIDVSGGWYDAGDFGKYVTPGAVTAAQLLLAYELKPEKFGVGQLKFPAGFESDVPGLPDALAEVKYELDWLLKMQRPDGAVYHKVSGLTWPGMIRPEDDTQPRYVFGMTTYGTGIFAGAMAMAARIYEPFDAEYAERLLEAAERAFRFLEENPEPIVLRSERQDNGSGPYDKSGDQDDRLWAAAELLKTTGDPRYAAYIDKKLSHLLTRDPIIIGWASTLTLGQFAYATAEAADPAVREAVKQKLVKAADDIVGRIGRDGYRYSLSSNEYSWASAKNGMAKAQLLLLANELEPKEAYLHGALDQIHYTLGRNAIGTTYLTGSGTEMPDHPHNRMIIGTGTYIPGLLVGGPNKFGGDPELDKLLERTSPPPAKAYLDISGSWASNEYAIDYNAPLVFALAWFAEP